MNLVTLRRRPAPWKTWPRRVPRVTRALLLAMLLPAALPDATAADPADWIGDLRPIGREDWNEARAAHLLERAGFGGTPAQVRQLAALGPQRAVRQLMQGPGDGATAAPPAFDHSGVHHPGLDPFPPSRPAATDQARDTGEALGIRVKPEGNRRLQPVVDEFFYWLRASKLETDRVGYWWADRMLRSEQPLVEKMALFWHGHFATHEAKVRDYRKMLGQLELFQRQGLGNFRDLLVATAQDPAMLSFLDAGVNVKGAPNENFAREIMEMFTLGVGQYGEADIREAARAFTGWNYVGTRFVVNRAQHDDGEKTVLGHRGRFDGVQVIDLLLARPAAAEYVAGRLYRFLVRDEPPPGLVRQLGERWRAQGYEIAPLLETILLSRDFHAAAGTRIKSPVELVVSTYRKLGVAAVPGIPDFNETTGALGQRLMYPPTVAGWAYGRSWITPGLLMERGNFVRDVLFPDFMAPSLDRVPSGTGVGMETRAVHERLRRGLDVTAATQPAGEKEGGEAMAMSNRVDRDEAFNTRLGSYRGWLRAVQAVKPIPRTMADPDVTGIVQACGSTTSAEAVDCLVRRFFSVPVDAATRAGWSGWLTQELGTPQLERARSYAEDPLRGLLHIMLSHPDYQLG